MIQQTVRHKADHPAARCKAGLLRGGVRTGSPAGDERKALGRSELSGLHGKAAVIRPELPRADERNAARAEQGRVAAAEQGGRAQVEHEEARPLGVLQPALVGGRYVFFCAEEGLLAVDVERDTFYRIALPPCGQGRAPGSYALDEQGRLLWSDELAGDGGDADARFYLLELPPLLDARGGRAPE